MAVPPPETRENWLYRTSWEVAQNVEILRQEVQALMTMQDQFNTELEKLGTAVTDMRTEVDMQLEQMSAVLDQLAANKPITQAQIDKLKAARNSIETSTGALRADNAPGEPLPPSPGPA